MGNGTSRVVGCLGPFNGKHGVELDFLEPLDEGLGHSFCYVRPSIFDSPAITPSNSERFTADSSTFGSETFSGSFRHETVEDPSVLHKLNKSFPETTFRTISGASVSANVSTARTGNQNASFDSNVQEPAASFESTASFAAIPLQPVPRCSGPLNGFMSGPLERGFASGPLDKGSGFMSGPMEKGVMSGPLDATDKSNFSAPLTRGRRRRCLHHLMRSVSGPMKSSLSRTFSKHSFGSGFFQRFFSHPVSQLAWNPKETKFPQEWPLESDYGISHDLQWAHGRAGEDRVHVVLSEEQGWLFIGIYDGFSGPDAPDFLMSNLYKAIDKELEGVLWDYGDKPHSDALKPDILKTDNRCSNQVTSCSLEDSQNAAVAREQVSSFETVEEKNEASSSESSKCEIPSVLGNSTVSFPPANIAGQGRRSMRLYELLQIELPDRQVPDLVSEVEKQRKSSWNRSQSSGTLVSRETLNVENLRSCSQKTKRDPTTSGSVVGPESMHQRATSDLSVSAQRKNTRRSSIGSKIKTIYKKQKSIRKKFFPWHFDWHREEVYSEERIDVPSGPIRRCKPGVVDHSVVLTAMTQALERTEEAYMEMVENDLGRNPELALMGSCVLVMLMKDQDVYVMNLGDSRAILAQERPNDRYPNPNSVKDDMRHKNRSRESLVRMELDRISEESPMHNQNNQANFISKNRELCACRLKMRAVQLSTDHSTNIKEEVVRIRGEHPDDEQAILNDRVKGQLKVTRAFGAGFLKKPTCNEALLEMFRINYIGSEPYLSCIPRVCHHRLSSSDRFLVLSSDGLYQFFSNEEVVAHVTWFIENVPEGDPAQYLIAELLFRAAKKNGMDFHELLDIPQGDRRKYHDDVSVMVVSLEGRIWRSSGW